jgi:hypothetical protein
MMMDDLGALIWRFGKKLVVNHAESESAPGHGDHKDPPAPPGIAHSPAAE